MITIKKPWMMYKSVQEIGEAIQQGLEQKMGLPTAVLFGEDQFLIVLKFPEHQAHIKFKLQDLKEQYKTAEDFVQFIYDCYVESVEETKNEMKITLKNKEE